MFRKLSLVIMLACVLASACSDGGKVGTLNPNGDDVDAGEYPQLDLLPGDSSGNNPDGWKENDLVGYDLLPPNPGEFGAPCTGNDDCISGYCIEGLNGYICTQVCVDECVDGYNCVGINIGPDLTFLCVPDLDRSCEPCTSDLQCSGGRCVAFGTQKYCLMPCAGGPCKQNYNCQALEINGVPQDLCAPSSGTCECGPGSVGLEKSCKKLAGTNVCYGVQFCEEEGWGDCALPDEVCDGKDNDCDGYVDDPWLNLATNKYESDANCGVCGNSCQAMTAAHASGKCSAMTTVPSCVWSCETGHFDVNDNPNDGCECTFVGDKDDPDAPGDANCDGIDGVVTGGIFVAKNGSDGNQGTWDKPVLSITKGIQLAKGKAGANGSYNLYVATGVYSESITMQAGISLYGGYSADFTTRDPLGNQTVIMGATYSTEKPGAVNAFDITRDTVFSGFFVFGADALTAGGSSYALYVARCDSHFRLVGNTVVAGNGRAGTPGTGGSDGTNGVDGTPGEGAYDILKTTCVSGDWTVPGQGGDRVCGGTDVSGGDGGAGICPDYDDSGTQPASIPYDQVQTTDEKGKAGLGTAGGAGGIAGWDSLIHDGGSSNCSICNVPKKPDGSQFLPTLGENGVPGGNGVVGTGANGCGNAAGSVSGGLWSGTQGAAGGTGTHGSGGGGGGAGGGVETKNCSTSPLMKYTDIGGGGGGGGSGGCAGTGGTGGKSGGGSFAFFLVLTTGASVPTLVDNYIQTGFGGDGGVGGTGGVGGKGGAGEGGGDSGEGQGSAWCADAGGHGGNGGDGGHGGGGGGGCGGPSFAIYVHNANPGAVTPWLTDNEFLPVGQPGTGGQGGKSLGQSGSDGANGAGGEINVL